MNNDLANFVSSMFAESIAIKQKSLGELLPKIIAAGELMISTLKQRGKILACGNGGSACDAEHMVGELVNRLDKERINLPAICLNNGIGTLTSLANDYGFEDIFAKQILALGQEQDVLVVFTTSGNSENILRAIRAAHEKGLRVIAINGRDGGRLAKLKLLHDDDIELRVSTEITVCSARIQETHVLLLHVLCALIDKIMFNLY